MPHCSLSHRRWFVAALTGVLALLSPARSASAQQAGITVGSPAPTVPSLETLAGGQYSLGDVVGKRPVVIEFWATWCPLCKALEPELSRARARFGDRVAFVGIGVPDNQTPERQQQFVTERQLSGIFLFDRRSEAMKAFQVSHTSFVVILDEKGRVAYTGVGGEQDLVGALTKTVGEK